MLYLIATNLLLIAASGDTSSPGTIRFPLKRSSNSKMTVKRDTLKNILWGSSPLHSIIFQLGTPPQLLEAILDTGSSDFIIVSGASLVTEDSKPGDPSRFDESYSSSFSSNKTFFKAKFVDKTFYEGEWAQDTFQAPGVMIPCFNFGLSQSGSTNHMVAGIGLATGECSYVKREFPSPYSNFPIQLKENGYINHVSYSIWLHHYGVSLGVIEFGGMDKRFMIGDMYRFPIVSSRKGGSEILALVIKIDEIYLIGNDNSHQLLADMSLPVLFDTGAVISRLPIDMAQKLYRSLGAFKYKGVYVVPCRRLINGGGIGLVMSGVEYMLPFTDIKYQLKGAPLCIPGFLEDKILVVGDNILRSLYMVFDLENLEIGIAMANPDGFGISATPVVFTSGIYGTEAPGYSSSVVGFWWEVYDVTFQRHRWHVGRTTTSTTAVHEYISLGCAASNCNQNNLHVVP